MSQGLFSVGGIASGLDTADIIEQLLALERQPVGRLERQQESLSAVKDAWGQVNTKLSSLRAATDKINRVDRFDGFMSTASSDPDAVSVTSTGTTDTGTLSFTVEQLARRMQSTSTETFTSRDAAIGDGTLKVTIGGVEHDLTAGLGPDPTLDDLVASINAADVGVRATALQISTGEYQLVLDAEATGSDGSFTVDAGGTAAWANAFTTSQTAQDATLKVGGITVTRSSNTISDLVDGATITLKQTTTAPVNVTSERDVDGAVGAVKEFVDGINGVLGTLKELTAYDPETNEAGLLQGDSSARQLVQSLRDAISRPIPGIQGSQGLASSLGISLTRDGMLAFDEAKVRQAFTDDFDGAAARIGRAGSTTDPAATFLSATSTAVPGTYGVNITQAAEAASTTAEVAYEPPGATEERTLRLTRANGQFTEITLTAEQANAEEAAAHIRSSLEAAGVSSFDIGTDGGALRVSTVAYGAGARFTITDLDGGDAFGLSQDEQVGVNVAGTIGGEVATGTGRTLQAIAGPANGLSVRVDGQPADFDVTWSRGIAGELGAALSRAEGINGTVSRARRSVDSQVKIYQDRIDSFERRLETREATIRRQFVAMETMLGQLNDQGNWLSQQLAGLSGLNQNN